jgi:PadR family transcriptional regulator, regulatory protein PadR
MNDGRQGESEGNPRSIPTHSSVDARPRNWLVPVTLAMLSQSSSYGYDIMKRTVEVGFEAVNPGTVYRTLRKMEKDGLCESEWETNSSSGRPPRRVYSLTDGGGAYLDLWVRSMEQYQRTMDGFLLAYKRAVSRS